MTDPQPPPQPAPLDPVAHAMGLIQLAWNQARLDGTAEEPGMLLAQADAWSRLTQAAALQRIAAALECLDRQAHDGSFRVVLTDEGGPAHHGGS